MAIATGRQHSRPLWLGFLSCALLPVLLLVVPLMFSKEGMIVPAALVALIAIPISLAATLCIALPFILLLRKFGRLDALWVCLAGLLVGAAVFAAFNYNFNYFPEMQDHALARWSAWQSAKSGAFSGGVLGLLSALALCLGAGIRLLPRRETDS